MPAPAIPIVMIVTGLLSFFAVELEDPATSMVDILLQLEKTKIKISRVGICGFQFDSDPRVFNLNFNGIRYIYISHVCFQAIPPSFLLTTMGLEEM